MKTSGPIGRADLVKALFSLDESMRAEAAELLGYVLEPRRRPAVRPEALLPAGTASGRPGASESGLIPRSTPPTPFWRLEKFTPRQKAEVEEAPPVKPPVWRNRPKEPPEHHWLENWRGLGPRLLKAVGGEGPGGEYDLDCAVRILSRGETLDLLPKKQRPRPPVKIQIVLDRSAHLMPYWPDQDAIVWALRHCFGAHAVETAFVRETADAPSPGCVRGGAGGYRLPPAGSVVLALGDLGALSPGGRREDSWLRFGRRIRAEGCRAVALTPAPAGLVPARLRRVWELTQWGRLHGEPVLDRDARLKTARRLLVLLSHAVRIEPGLLRAMRLAFGRDAGAEAEAWGQLALKHPSAGTPGAEAARELRAEFEQESDEVKQAALLLQWKWRRHTAREIWFNEILSMPPKTRKLLPHHGDVKQARRFFAFAREASRPGLNRNENVASWLAGRVEPRATEDAWKVPEVAQALFEAMSDDPDFVLPGCVDPAVIDVSGDFEGPVQFELAQGFLRMPPSATDGGDAAPHLGVLPTGNGLLNHSVIIDPRPDPALFWRDREAPPWASGWGEDEFGAWAEFAVGGVAQRLRWAPPGRFMMGSPEDEEGRYNDEGPRHEVTIGDGFWIMDTPVRQSLWRAVTGDNPSKFQGPERPVEHVSWEMAQLFLSRLNEKTPGLELALPSEAQWEYACRAGCDAAAYAEDLDQIAWWSGNSQSETHPVAQKQANDLGLFDMLGNVWEWCADHWHDDYKGAPTDGSAWMDDDGDAAAYRVLRGGSWFGGARSVRAACRRGFLPAYRCDIVGFRCVRVHTSDRRGAAAPGDRGDAQQAERRAAARSIGDAAAVRLTPEKPAASVELPLVGRLRITSDSAELEFAQIGRPVWASAMGCDQFGLFAEFKIDDVIQRLRWMPPGRFMMGSPEDEKGRFSSEGPRHEVTFGSGFWMMDTPVRQCLWQAATGDNPSKFQGPERPVESVDWNMTQEFLSRLNSRIAGLNLTLPSEAQWEYACRAGGDAAAYSEDLGQIAWYSENSKKQTHPVGQKLANAYGLYDMLGNVWEWCEDHWRDSYKNAPTDGSAWRGKKAAADRVLRGGSWFYVARDVRAACRLVYPPASRVDFVGFRCVRVHS